VTPNPIPSRFRSTAYQAVAHIWDSALKQWPKPLIVNPAPLTLESYAKKLRDGRTARELHGWKYVELEDEAKWQELASTFTIHIEGPNVVIRNPHCKLDKNKKVGEVEKPHVIKIFEWNQAYIEQLCCVLSKHWMKPQPHFLISGVSIEVINELESRFDIGFVKTENDGEYMTI
jgi:hypothetical protein